MVIYEEEGAWLWIGYPLNVCNILEDRDLQTLVGCTEFDVSHANRILRPSHDRWTLRVGSRYRRSVPSAKMMPVRVKFLILMMFRDGCPPPSLFRDCGKVSSPRLGCYGAFFVGITGKSLSTFADSIHTVIIAMRTQSTHTHTIAKSGKQWQSIVASPASISQMFQRRCVFCCHVEHLSCGLGEV